MSRTNTSSRPFVSPVTSPESKARNTTNRPFAFKDADSIPLASKFWVLGSGCATTSTDTKIPNMKSSHVSNIEGVIQHEAAAIAYRRRAHQQAVIMNNIEN